MSLPDTSMLPEILNSDLLGGLVDNLKIKYPILIDGVVPDKISYTLLTDMVKRIMRRDGAVAYLPKIIEVMDSVMGWQKDISAKELEDEIIKEIKRKENFKDVLKERGSLT